MKYHDPARDRLANGRPCWLDSVIALPRMELEPYENDQSHIYVRFMHGARGAYLEKTIHKQEILPIIRDWELDPEATFMQLFGLHDWPRGTANQRYASVYEMKPAARPQSPSTHQRLEDLL